MASCRLCGVVERDVPEDITEHRLVANGQVNYWKLCRGCAESLRALSVSVEREQ